MSTFIKDLIDIPEHIQRGDFVLKLAEGVNRATETLRDYVVTPELQGCFDDALSFIHSALQSQTSKASYLHGSFGSGKSHFMAVLHLILLGNAEARSIPELAPVIARHNAWTPGKRFLLVPYHMIDAYDMESAIMGGYVEFIRRTHPEAPIPGVYLAEGLFQDARALRARMGDEAFFDTLSHGTNSDGGWGELEAVWDAARFDAAMDEPPGSEARSRLIGDLVKTFFRSYDMQVSRRGEAYLPLDTGFAVLSKHAASLGYDALILFLDELILWLASRAADLKFVHQEGQKLAKLVEAQTPDRPVPIVSFVARQRDLSELIGEAIIGAERLNFSDALKHWEGRFHRITLEDRNLPAIAEKRVLKCKHEAARIELDAAFEQTAKFRETVMNTLLTSDGDRAMFRRVYPFSPALVQTLIAVSSALQRERTALKVMMQLLVEQRDHLKVGDIVPVGDLFDVVAHGDEAFSPEMAIHFDNAKRLYHQKLLPVLENQHGRREDIEALAADDPKRVAFRNDDRLVKTLLLSALTPNVESLRSLNAERLAALNHGTIKTPIPGREGQEVLRRCRAWAASVGEIRIGEEVNPTISVQLSGVDTEAIIAQVRGEDNHGNRMRRVRQMLFEQLKIEGEGDFEPHHDFLWRHTRRTCTVLFRNIRDLPDTSLDNTGEAWKLVIDYPFDEAGRTPRDDLSKIQAFRQAHAAGAKTLCWVPAFFSVEAQRDLGMLVMLEHILTGERFASFANHLSPQDRQAAKSLLENQRSVLRQRVQNHLEAAYGLESLTPGSIDPTHDLELHERFQSLWPGFDPQPPVAARLDGAIVDLLSQALAHEFPAAPLFEAEIKSSTVRRVYEYVRMATQTEDGRVAVDKSHRPLLRQIANPLQLGEMGYDATHFVLGQHWRTHFSRKAAEAGGAITVSQLRRWIDEPRPMGLPREVENLLVLLFADQTQHAFFLHGGPFEAASLTSLPEALELRQQTLPEPEQWQMAMARAGHIFGIEAMPLLSGTNVNRLATEIKAQVPPSRAHHQRYSQLLKDRCQRLGLDPSSADRLKTALATLALVERLHDVEPHDVVHTLATVAVATSEAAMGECWRRAADLARVLDTTNWEIFEAVATLTDERQRAAAELGRQVCQALMSDEHVTPLATALKAAQSKAVRLLAPTVAPAPPVISKPVMAPPEPVTPPLVVQRQVVAQGSEPDVDLEAAHALLARLEGERQSGQTLRISLSWVIEAEGAGA